MKEGQVIGGGGHEGRFSRDPLPVFSTGDYRKQLRHRQGSPFFDVVHSAFLLPTAESPSLRDALKGDFGEAVVACDMPEPCRFPSSDSCQKGFSWDHKEADLSPHLVVGFVLQVGDAEKFPQALGLEKAGSFSQTE